MLVAEDRPDTSDYAKGLLSGVIEISGAYATQIEEDEYRNKIARLVSGACDHGKALLQMNISRNVIYTRSFLEHTKNCSHCKLVAKQLNRRLKRLKI